MQLLDLTLYNFGVFRGQHKFNLMPLCQEDGTFRHLTLIAGHNGSGKSTLFLSLALGLYGSLALGDRVSRQHYKDFLLSRLHKASLGRKSLNSDEASIAVRFQYVHSGHALNIQVKRYWRRNGSNIQETLTVLCNGKPPEVEPVDYQAWLNDLVPPYLAPFCFLDAEQLDALTNTERWKDTLSSAIRRLLGLDLIERLESDLEHYILRQGGGRKTSHLRKEVLRHQSIVDSLDAQLAKLCNEAEALSRKEAELEIALAQKERCLVAEGGNYAARRPFLKERLYAVGKEIEDISRKLRDLSAGLLPFTLAPELCQALSQRLAREAELQRQRITGEFLNDNKNTLKLVLEGDEFWREIEVTPRIRQIVTKRLIHLLQQMMTYGESDSEPHLIHYKAEPEQKRLQNWIFQVLNTVPQQVQALGNRLRALRNEQHHIETELQRVPDSEMLAPIYTEISQLEEALAKVRQHQNTLNKNIGALQFQRDERYRELQRAVDQLKDVQAKERKLELAERSKLVMRAYRDALIRQRLTALEEALVVAFNTICHKKHLLRTVHIRADDLSIELQDADGNVLTLADFSAGERQLHALAFMWALRKVSGRKLPLAIDTPLARLDEIHRWRLMHSYIPAVSNQVLLFVTDTEVDESLLAQASPYLARIYRLEYDSQHQETSVTCENQPVPDGVVLYQSKISSEISISRPSSCAQTWKLVPDRVSTHGKLERVLLPSTAKRLVLVDPITKRYNWTHISELERIINNESIADQLRNGSQLYNLWCEEWTRRLQEAGYDSFTIVGDDGPEEHVLNPSKLIPLDSFLSSEKEMVDGT